MAINPHDDYEKLAKLLYPSIEASGNVYYGQTRKLALDELFNKNEFGFESYMSAVKKFNSESNEEYYENCYNWKLGPLNGAFTYEQRLDDTCTFAKYIVNSTTDSILSSTNAASYTTYETNLSTTFCELVRTRNKSPINEEENYDDRNFYLLKSDDAVFLYVIVERAYKGNGKILTVTAVNSSVTVKIKQHGNVGDIMYRVLKPDNTWATFTSFNIEISLNAGESAYFMCVSRGNQNDSNYIYFEFSGGDVRLSGNVSSIASSYPPASYEYAYLFKDCSQIIDASQLIISSVNSMCCKQMFYGCNKLAKPPKLIATELATGCYYEMFVGCQSLVKAPDLPAESRIFGHSNYPAERCYYHMFYNCASLNEVKCYLNEPQSMALDSWLYGTNSTGTVYVKDTAVESWSDVLDSYSGVPSGWQLKSFSDSTTSERLFSNNRMLVSGSDNVNNGRGLLNNSTLSNMEKSFDENNTHQMNSYNTDGSYNQEIWGYKCFNSPVQFRNGVYGEYSSLVSFNNDNHTGNLAGKGSTLQCIHTIQTPDDAASTFYGDGNNVTSNISVYYDKNIDNEEFYFVTAREYGTSSSTTLDYSTPTAAVTVDSFNKSGIKNVIDGIPDCWVIPYTDTGIRCISAGTDYQYDSHSHFITGLQDGLRADAKIASSINLDGETTSSYLTVDPYYIALESDEITLEAADITLMSNDIHYNNSEYISRSISPASFNIHNYATDTDTSVTAVSSTQSFLQNTDILLDGAVHDYRKARASIDVSAAKCDPDSYSGSYLSNSPVAVSTGMSAYLGGATSGLITLPRTRYTNTLGKNDTAWAASICTSARYIEKVKSNGDTGHEFEYEVYLSSGEGYISLITNTENDKASVTTINDTDILIKTNPRRNDVPPPGYIVFDHLDDCISSISISNSKVTIGTEYTYSTVTSSSVESYNLHSSIEIINRPYYLVIRRNENYPDESTNSLSNYINDYLANHGVDALIYVSLYNTEEYLLHVPLTADIACNLKDNINRDYYKFKCTAIEAIPHDSSLDPKKYASSAVCCNVGAILPMTTQARGYEGLHDATTVGTQYEPFKEAHFRYLYADRIYSGATNTRKAIYTCNYSPLGVSYKEITNSSSYDYDRLQVGDITIAKICRRQKNTSGSWVAVPANEISRGLILQAGSTSLNILEKSGDSTYEYLAYLSDFSGNTYASIDRYLYDTDDKLTLIILSCGNPCIVSRIEKYYA